MSELRTQASWPAFARIGWMIVGPLALFMFTLKIAQGGGWLTLADLGYLVMLGVVLGARWLEYQSGQAQTGTGEPLTPAGFHKAIVLTAGIGLAVWAGANVLGNHLLGS